MSLSNLRLKYWSQFINHEILFVSGIRWYIANLLVRSGMVFSVEQVVNLNHSEHITSYVHNKAICIYQTCYHDLRYYSFKVMDYDSYDSMRGMTGRILSYDTICHQYNVVVNMIQHSSMKEIICHLSPSVMEPDMILPTEMNWSNYHLSRKSKISKGNVVLLNPPQHILSTLSPNFDLQSVLMF